MVSFFELRFGNKSGTLFSIISLKSFSILFNFACCSKDIFTSNLFKALFLITLLSDKSCFFRISSCISSINSLHSLTISPHVGNVSEAIKATFSLMLDKFFGSCIGV